MNNLIILTTLNARYSHTSIGLRYLYANLKELQSHSEIQEYTIKEKPLTIAENLLKKKPFIIGFGIYIWNALETQQVIHFIKKVSPETHIILGGPEVSYSPLRVHFDQADFIIQGEADLAFHQLCQTLIDNRQPQDAIFKAKPFKLEDIKLPYSHYSNHDLKHRITYIEASRGCPFTCEFCLSSLDQKVRKFDIDILLKQLEDLWIRGGRNFKFIDRTFNLSQYVTNKILDFFLDKKPPFFVHFEMIPDHFPENLKEKMTRFEATTLQLEIGIQTLNPAISTQLKRKLKVDKIKKNLKFLSQKTRAHLHLDLIVGLPGESLDSFANNLNTLVELVNCEIQIGILKKLSGTSLYRHDSQYDMIYSDIPPYDILENNLIPFYKMQEMKRFARFWDLTYNSGNFKYSIGLLWPDGKVFQHFLKFSNWLYKETQSTWNISLSRLSEYIYIFLTEQQHQPSEVVALSLLKDLSRIKGRKVPSFLKPYLHPYETINSQSKKSIKRQIKHSMV